jgi:hypothetical protein
MNLPKTLKIGGHIYRVVFPYYFKELGSGASGQRDGQLMEVRINDRDPSGSLRSDSSICVSLIHEIFHALDELTGQELFKGDEGEKYLNALSEIVYLFLVDNGYWTSTSSVTLTIRPQNIEKVLDNTKYGA